MLKGDGIAMHGEWFDIKPDKAMEVVQFAADGLGVALRTDIPLERLEHTLYVFQYDLEDAQARRDAENGPEEQEEYKTPYFVIKSDLNT